jgi:mono/diheme cytochrome c family protein
MKSLRSFLVASVMVRMAVACGLVAGANPVDSFFERHCYDCHSGDKPEAGLDLKKLPRSLADPAFLGRWTRIHDRIARGEMPPADAERPDADDVAAVTARLDAGIFKADAARRASQGRAAVRRLTAAEYANTLRDLLALERLDLGTLLPPDGSVAGYTKIGDGLDISPVHLEAYTAAAEKALTAAIATRSTAPPVVRKRFRAASRAMNEFVLQRGVLLKERQRDPLLPFPAEIPPPAPNEEASIQRVRDRKAVIQSLKLEENDGSVGLLGHYDHGLGGSVGLYVAPIFPGRYRVRLSLWGFTWNQGAIEPAPAQAAMLWAHPNVQAPGRPLTIFTAPSLAPRVHEAEFWLDAHETVMIDPVSLDRGRLLRFMLHEEKLLMKYIGPGVALDWFEFEGPLHESWPPESHRRLFGDLPIGLWEKESKAVPPQRDTAVWQHLYHFPEVQKDLPQEDRVPRLETVRSNAPADDARRLLAAFLSRAFRRPVPAETVARYVALVESRLAADDCFEDAMRRAYVAALTSPEFLFHVCDAKADLFALASRLSYWLWNSPPDDALLAAAADGTLAHSNVLKTQIDRLLDDPRSGRFIADFADQWLDLRRIDETVPDRQLYPEYSRVLGDDMVAETRAFLAEILAKDLPAAALVDADFAMLTQRLAEHYGIPGVEGVEVRRVPVAEGSHRGGLLTQASMLKLTANGTTTSPVKRGVWVMDRLLDEPPPPPPPVAAVEPDTRGTTTIREQLAKHRADASCAACHQAIDAPGFALESFDPIGGFRDRYRSTGRGDPLPEPLRSRWINYRLGPPVDATGELPGRGSFRGIDDLKRLLAADDRRLGRAFAAHMIRYATGADISYADRRTIEAILDATAETRYGVRSIIHAIAVSDLLPKRSPSTAR